MKFVKTPPARRSVIQSCACFLGALVASCAIISSFMPFWPAPDVFQKWQYVAAHRDEFDTLFIGSSMIRHHAIPPQFDAEMAASGTPTKSFNFGCSGMWPPESYYVARSILKLRPPHLRWVFIDAIDMNTKATGQEVTTLRSVHWHDAIHTWFAFRAIWDSHRAFSAKPELWWAHGYALGIRMVNSGRGSDWLSQKFQPPRKSEAPPAWAPASGFEPLRGKLSGATSEAFERAVQSAKEKQPAMVIRPGLAAAVRSLASDLRQANIEPIFIMPPLVGSTSVQDWPAEVALLCFNDPVGCAPLYDPALRYDTGHLNEEGARVFTSLLAQKFQQWRQAHPSVK